MTENDKNFLSDWFGSREYSPENYPMNLINDVRIISDNTVVLEFSPKPQSRNYRNIYEENNTDTDKDEIVLYTSVVSLKNINSQYKNIIFKKVLTNECQSDCNKICLYSDVFVDSTDILSGDYEFLTEDIANRISDESDRFSVIEISAAFTTYDSLCNVLGILYERLSDKSSSSYILLHLDCTFQKDGQATVMLSDALSSGYLPNYFMNNPPCDINFSFRRLNMFDMSIPEEFNEEYTRYTSIEE